MAVAAIEQLEHMDIVIVGHVDHGKSTVIGRLMADTGSLPQGKLEQVKAMCERNARPFEYAFLLDALKNEQAQGITIDAARVFFKTAKRRYIIHDAPGHIEFLKNMVTGAARAEAALLVIDAHEGIQENTKRHGYMVSMLGVKEIAVLVNKMDLVGYSREVFEHIQREYTEFLAQLGVHPLSFIPVSARMGVNIAHHGGGEMPWYGGKTLLEQVDAFVKRHGNDSLPFRMPVQDIYKFTDQNDDRRIVAGTIATGKIAVGDEVVFYPSRKESRVKSIEGFNTPVRTEIGAPFAAGFTLATQIYIKPGEMMCKKDEPRPHVGRRFRVNLFWMGRPPMVKNKRYKLKVGAMAVQAELAEVIQVLDASELSTVENKEQIDRHDVAEVILETVRPVAFDLRNDLEPTGRIIIVDDFEIAGAAVVLQPLGEEHSVMQAHIADREYHWERGLVPAAARAAQSRNIGKLIIFHGEYGCGKRRLAKQLEKRLFDEGHRTYYFGISNYFEELDHDVRTRNWGREQHLQRLGELARVITDAGLLLITTVTDADDYDMARLRELNTPSEIFVVHMGEDNPFHNFKPDLHLPYRPEMDFALNTIEDALKAKGILLA